MFDEKAELHEQTTWHKERRKTIQEYLTRINNAEDKEVELLKVINTEKRTIPDLINTVLTTILLIIIVTAVIQGKYIDTHIKFIETCNGQILYNQTNQTTQEANIWTQTQIQNKQSTK